MMIPVQLAANRTLRCPCCMWPLRGCILNMLGLMCDVLVYTLSRKLLSV